MIGETILQLRKQNNWSQQHVAKQLGIAKSTYAGYESGYREPSLDTVRQLAELFEVSIDQLAGQDDAATAAATVRPEQDRWETDTTMEVWFQELLEAPEERREELRKIWEIIKVREAGRTPGSRQGDT